MLQECEKFIIYIVACFRKCVIKCLGNFPLCDVTKDMATTPGLETSVQVGINLWTINDYKSNPSSWRSFDLYVFPRKWQFLSLLPVSLAKWQHVTAVTGQTVYLRCPMTGARETSMDWQNPEGYTIFFKKISGEGSLYIQILRSLRPVDVWNKENVCFLVQLQESDPPLFVFSHSSFQFTTA